LSACSSQTSDSRYATAQDSAPLQPIAAEDVADAVVRHDPILAAGNRSPYKVNGVSYRVMEDHRGYRERGIASWYGAKFNGHKTSNGEIFDLYLATAAHKTLPIPSYAKVTNLENGRSVIVRVNDRGPFHPQRIIDLSYAAAVKLDYMNSGTATVEVESIDVAGVDDRRATVLGSYRYLQMGAFSDESAAWKLQSGLKNLTGLPVALSPVEAGGQQLYRVRIGPAKDERQLEALQRILIENGFGPGQPLP